MILNVEGLDIDDIGDSLRKFSHLRFLNLSKNYLRDISDIQFLPNLVSVNASSNLIENVDFLDTNYNDYFSYLIVTILKNFNFDIGIEFK